MCSWRSSLTATVFVSIIHIVALLDCSLLTPCRNDFYCIQILQLERDKDGIIISESTKRSCEPKNNTICSLCKDIKQRGGACLIHINSNIKVKCCSWDGCNRSPIKIVHRNHRGFTYLPFSHTAVQYDTLWFILAVLLYSSIYAYIKNRARRRYLLYDYNTVPDGALLAADIEIFRTMQKEGRSLDGQLSASELHSVLLFVASKGTKKMPVVAQSGKLNVEYVTHEAHQATGYDRLVIIRDFQTKYESLLWRMIEQGPGFFRMEPIELRDLFEEVSDIVDSESSLLELPSDLVIVGDLRGRYCDLLRWFQLYGYPPKRRYLFLGGIVDSENPDSMETITLIAALKRVLPYDVFILRGATEYLTYRPKTRFPKRLCGAIAKLMARLFDTLPLAALINFRILAVHSGIDAKMYSFESIKQILRPLKGAGGQLPRGIIFNIPRPGFNGFKTIRGSRGHYFGEEDVNKCIETLGLSLIIRSRTPCPNGYFTFANGRMLSIWSNNGRSLKMATTLSINADMQISLHSLRSSYCMN
uniref:Serine/threonine-protein phosphatase PP1 isozyme 7 n=1 Tax=Ascaris suum TaxID=6253 RepID=F1KXV4_ASCSU